MSASSISPSCFCVMCVCVAHPISPFSSVEFVFTSTSRKQIFAPKRPKTLQATVILYGRQTWARLTLIYKTPRNKGVAFYDLERQITFSPCTRLSCVPQLRQTKLINGTPRIVKLFSSPSQSEWTSPPRSTAIGWAQVYLSSHVRLECTLYMCYCDGLLFFPFFSV